MVDQPKAISTGVILAAGRGSRLKELSLTQPKPMIVVNDVTIISNLVRSLVRAGLKKVVVVVGYMSDVLMDHLSPFSSQTELVFIDNKDFATTNNIYSLWMASDHLKDGFFLYEADVFTEESLVHDFMKSRYENVMLVDKFTDEMNGTVITFDQDRVVSGMFLKKDQNDSFTFDDKYKTVNFYRISAKLSTEFFLPRLNDHVEKKQVGSYYELVIQEALDKGITFHAFEADSKKWFEIDTAEDLELARKLFKPVAN